ncbi:hypothetical protein DFP97_108217 [Paenibacillus prosopidis]|uniref:APO domain-containing protein n=1 Tax=Paenibacillus prosopidis TaxID=630520 RepID=A0A368W1F1_9BACL|nr:hypothetical protein DFP97_108217 [Paenibacillus prosopidis]
MNIKKLIVHTLELQSAKKGPSQSRVNDGEIALLYSRFGPELMPRRFVIVRKLQHIKQLEQQAKNDCDYCSERHAG